MTRVQFGAPILAACMSIGIAWNAEAGRVVKGDLGGTYGLLYECAFAPLNTPKLDGKSDDFPWSRAPWHEVTHKDGTGPAPDDKDASFKFAACADDKWLYVVIVVTDDTIKSNENVLGDVWKDDSVEIYIDANNGKTQAYERKNGDWDCQISIGADNIGGDIKAPKLGGTGDGPTVGIQAAVAASAGGYTVEAAIPLNSPDKWNWQLKNGMLIGFNVHLNDDDDGGERDHKLIWSANDVDDQSWQNPSRFAELKFVALALAVDPAGKLPAAWGGIKTAH